MIIIAEVSEITRKIKLPTDRVLSVNGDYQVDGIAFKLPATYEGDFDFSTAAARVHWTGVDKVEHTNLIAEEDENGYPLWVMPSELTQGGHGVIEFAVSFVATDATAAVTKRWISDPVSFRNRRTVNGSNEDEEAEEETTYDRLASAIAAVRTAQASVDDVNAILAGIASATPTVVETVADLNGLDTSKVKLAIVAADGYLYYYNGTAWKSGFAYGGLQEVIAARTDSEGVTHADLKTRLNTAESQIKEDLTSVSKDVARQDSAVLDEGDVIGNSTNYFIPSNKRESGIIYTYDRTARSITAVGTATSICFFNFCGGTSTVPSFVKKGAKYLLSFETTDANINVQVTINIDGTNAGSVESGISPIYFEVPSNATGLAVRAVNRTGDIVNGTVSGFTFIEIVRSTLKSTGDTTDRTAEILYALTKCGKCHLAGGDYYIGNLVMPNNTTLDGDGDATRIYCTSDGAGIEMGARCTVKDLTLYGDTADITLPSSDSEPEIGTKHGILLRGEDKEFGHISGCRVERFNGAGIIAYDTGTAVDNGFEIIGGFIRNCTVGIYSKRNAEFINIVGVTICRNWYGFLCRSGSNYCSNCYFLSNVVNAQIDNAEGSNGGHAAITGGVFGHANNNTGYGLIVRGTGRMMITGANIYYGKLLLDHTNGNVISSCGFGSSTAWEINGTDGEGGCNIFIGCMLRTMSDTPITITDNAQTKIVNCFTRYGAEVTV